MKIITKTNKPTNVSVGHCHYFNPNGSECDTLTDEFLMFDVGYEILMLRPVCQFHKNEQPWKQVSLGKPIKIVKPTFEQVEDLS